MSNDPSTTPVSVSLTTLAWEACDKLATRPVKPGLRGWLIDTAEKLGKKPEYLKQSVEIFRAVASWPHIPEQDMEQRALAGFNAHVRLMPDPNDRVAVYEAVVLDPLSSPLLRFASVLGIIRDAGDERTEPALRARAISAASKVINANSAAGRTLYAMRAQHQPGFRPTLPNRLNPQLT